MVVAAPGPLGSGSGAGMTGVVERGCWWGRTVVLVSAPVPHRGYRIGVR